MTSGVGGRSGRNGRRAGPAGGLAARERALLVGLLGVRDALAAGEVASGGGAASAAEELALLLACAALHGTGTSEPASRHGIVEWIAAVAGLAEWQVDRLAGLGEDVVDPLLSAAHEAVGDGCMQVDPFERLLAAMAPARRRSHGVYFTPDALVDHLLGRVDTLLRDELGLADGLADMRSYGEAGLAGAGPDDDAPLVHVLDPAAGTGAFLCGVVRRVHAAWEAGARVRGLDTDARARQWRDYVPKGLLPRLSGVELSLAACAIARIRLSLALRATGVDLQDLGAVSIHCGNALGEGALVEHGPTSVVVGNPPYARGSRNRGAHLDALLAEYKRGLEGERNLQPLADDYIKFMRVAQVQVHALPVGVVAVVTNHAMLSGRLHRSMRRSLGESFPWIEVLDLHGSTKAHRGSGKGPARDENVFPISQGVCACVMAKGPSIANQTIHGELRGSRADKLRCLASGTLPTPVAFVAEPPLHLWAPRAQTPSEYAGFVPLPELFEFYSVGGKPGDDALLVGFEAEELPARLRRAREAVSMEGAATEARTKLARWSAGRAFTSADVRPYDYRPFDTRYVYDAPEIWTRPVMGLRARLDGAPVLLTTRLVKDSRFEHVFATRGLPDVIFLSATSSVNCYAFAASALRPERLSEIQPTPSRDASMAYLYGVLHSRGYRARYRSALEHDFPRVPLPVERTLFEHLRLLGERLLMLHLGDARVDPDDRPGFHDGGGLRLSRVGERGRRLLRGGRLRINDESYFEPISEGAWAYRVGSYAVLHKWLDDRRRAGRALSRAEVEAYRDVVARVTMTVRCMDQVERAIEGFGGWPKAFQHRG